VRKPLVIQRLGRKVGWLDGGLGFQLMGFLE
jgi:hypothetical protein